MTATVMIYSASPHVTAPQANSVTAHTHLGEPIVGVDLSHGLGQILDL